MSGVYTLHVHVVLHRSNAFHILGVIKASVTRG